MINGVILPVAFSKNYREDKMKRYVAPTLEVKNIEIIDIITTSPTDLGQDSPGIGLDDDMLG